MQRLEVSGAVRHIYASLGFISCCYSLLVPVSVLGNPDVIFIGSRPLIQLQNRHGPLQAQAHVPPLLQRRYASEFPHDRQA